jgi:hypothetical protein
MSARERAALGGVASGTATANFSRDMRPKQQGACHWPIHWRKRAGANAFVKSADIRRASPPRLTNLFRPVG